MSKMAIERMVFILLCINPSFHLVTCIPQKMFSMEKVILHTKKEA